MTAFEQMLDELRNQQELLHELKLKLDELEVHGGGGGSGRIYARNVTCTPPDTGITNMQLAFNDLYTKFGNMNVLE